MVSRERQRPSAFTGLGGLRRLSLSRVCVVYVYVSERKGRGENKRERKKWHWHSETKKKEEDGEEELGWEFMQAFGLDSHHIAPTQGLLFSYGIIWLGDLNAGKRALGFQFGKKTETRQLKKKKKRKNRQTEKETATLSLMLLYRSTLISLAWLKFTGSN